MKKLLMAAVALTAISATPAFAVTAAGTDFAVTGTVTAQCGALVTKPIAFSTLTLNAADGKLVAHQTKTSDGQSVYCNGVNSKITVGHTALDNTTIGATVADTTSFTRTIDFTPKVVFDDVTIDGDHVDSALGAKAGTMTVTAYDLTAGAKAPYAGDYSGKVTVTLTPAA